MNTVETLSGSDYQQTRLMSETKSNFPPIHNDSRNNGNYSIDLISHQHTHKYVNSKFSSPSSSPPNKPSPYKRRFRDFSARDELKPPNQDFTVGEYKKALNNSQNQNMETGRPYSREDSLSKKRRFLSEEKMLESNTKPTIKDVIHRGGKFA
mgnify:CR=1 FL=1